MGDVTRSNRPPIDHFDWDGVGFLVEQDLVFGGEGGIDKVRSGATIN